MQLSGNFETENPCFEKFWAQSPPPPWGQNSAGPIEKSAAAGPAEASAFSRFSGFLPWPNNTVNSLGTALEI